MQHMSIQFDGIQVCLVWRFVCVCVCLMIFFVPRQSDECATHALTIGILVSGFLLPRRGGVLSASVKGDHSSRLQHAYLKKQRLCELHPVNLLDSSPSSALMVRSWY